MSDVKHTEPQVLRQWMIKYICDVLGLKPETFSTTDSFDIYGLDSVEAVIMAGAMEEEFQVVVDPHLFYDYHSVDAFVEAFTSGAARTA
jgi:acyl carrier protein